MNNAIGGYFELADRERKGNYPVNGIRLNTSRNALEYIIRCLPDCKHIYLPLYTCDTVIEPLNRLPGISFSFYHINDKFEIADNLNIGAGEYLIANNYYGLKDTYIKKLAYIYGDRLIVDNAQALFAPVQKGIKAIYSARKFVGVADGGFAVGINTMNEFDYEQDNSSLHNSHLFTRKQNGAEAGFMDYRQNERKLNNQPIRKMSCQTEDILQHIDYDYIIARRRTNYKYLDNALKHINLLNLPNINSFVCPMVYPFYTKDHNLRNLLIKNRIYVACYWRNVTQWTIPCDLEYKLTIGLCPLPIDQRYEIEDMDRILNIIKKYYDNKRSER